MVVTMEEWAKPLFAVIQAVKPEITLADSIGADGISATRAEASAILGTCVLNGYTIEGDHEEGYSLFLSEDESRGLCVSPEDSGHEYYSVWFFDTAFN